MPRPFNMTDAEMKAWLETQYDLNENGCWVWKGSKIIYGYGQVRWRGAGKRVHRLYWVLSGREIPDGLELCHGLGCSKACYNPNHLRADTARNNQLDRRLDGTAGWKLTREQVLEIRSRIDMNCTELAREYEVSCSQISLIKAGKTWNWL